MTITTEQRQAIEQGRAVEVQLNGTTCVLVRKDVYDRVQRVFDDGDMDPRETYPAILATWDAAGSPEDATDYHARTFAAS